MRSPPHRMIYYVWSLRPLLYSLMLTSELCSCSATSMTFTPPILIDTLRLHWLLRVTWQPLMLRCLGISKWWTFFSTSIFHLRTSHKEPTAKFVRRFSAAIFSVLATHSPCSGPASVITVNTSFLWAVMVYLFCRFIFRSLCHMLSGIARASSGSPLIHLP